LAHNLCKQVIIEGWRAAWQALSFGHPRHTSEAGLSRLSHRLTGRHRTRADGLDIQWTLACGYRFWRTDRTGGIDLRIRRLGDRVPPSAHRSTANPGRTTSRCGSSCSGKVQQSLAVKLLSQPAKRFAGGLVGNLGVDFHGDRDLAVAEYPHRYPRVHVESGQQRGA